MISKVTITDRLKLTAEQLEQLRPFYPNVRFKEPKDYYAWNGTDEEKAAKQLSEFTAACDGPLIPVKEGSFLANITALFSVCPFINCVTIEQVIPYTEQQTSASFIEIASLISKLEEAAYKVKKGQELFNEKCSVHIGGNMLLNINELMLKEDACTDALQNDLDNGWRIVSVCVQPDGRRPDYILGRFNPTRDSQPNKGAVR